MNLEAQHGKSIQVEVEIEIEVDMERVLQEQAAGGEGPPRSDPRLLGDAAELDGKRAVKGPTPDPLAQTIKGKPNHPRRGEHGHAAEKERKRSSASVATRVRRTGRRRRRPEIPEEEVRGGQARRQRPEREEVRGGGVRQPGSPAAAGAVGAGGGLVGGESGKRSGIGTRG